MLDLEGDIEALDAAMLRRIFTGDGIHLTQHGLAVFAGRLAQEIEGLLAGVAL